MLLCGTNPQLLGARWALVLVRRQAGRRNRRGHCALMVLLRSDLAASANFRSEGFRLLFRREKDIVDARCNIVL